ncbi:MAG: TldD/PmbA family protein [Candidatus Goldbacteria bacterium]|nr:TldD/PmbA family protein [Candidatus Goldiibacteriota bacterium]
MDILEKAGSLLSSYNFDLWDIFFENTETKIISLENSKIDQFTCCSLSGIGIKGVKDFNIFYNCTDEVKEKKVLNAVRNIKNNFLTSGKKKTKNYIRRIIPPDVNKIKIPHNKIKTDKKIELLKEMDNFVRKISHNIKQVKLTISEKIQEVKILNDTGNYVKDRRIYTTFIIFIMAGKGNSIETGYSVISGACGYELLKQNNLKEKSRETAEAALRLLDINEKITGEMPAVISAEAGGTLIHEAIGHSLEADLVQKNLSEYKGKIGQVVASPLITVIDDATIPGKRGSYSFDDEGIKAKKTILIENGILKNYLYDRVTAFRDGKVSTGNGRRESFFHIPIPRMSNIYIKPGKGKEADLIKDTKNGIYIKKMGGGQVNTVTGEFIFEIKEGFKIENGKIVKPVRDATLLGKGQDILKNIDAVCDDLGFESGTCGKDGQGVPVSDAQPTLRIPKILIGSK